jgi:hypothetical protein
MTRVFLFAVVLTVTVGDGIAAERVHFAPVDGNLSVLAVAPAHQAYHVAARDALVGVAGSRTWEAMVIPSFEKEWAVYVERDGARGKQQVVCTVMQEQLWYQMEGGAEHVSGVSYAQRQKAALEKANRKIWRYASPISATTAAALEDLWSTMLLQARVPAEQPRCIDGTSYFLFQWAGSVRGRGGWARCPQKSTPVAAALEILEGLCAAAINSKAGSSPGERQLVEEIGRIQGSLK